MRRATRGFTLIELLIVIALVAIASAVASLALRDPDASQLEREAARLAALLESARAESRVLGVPVLWVPRGAADIGGAGFRFVGLPATLRMPERWLGDEAPAVEIASVDGPARLVRLGPEPIIGAQRIALLLGDRRIVLATDGLGPFALAAEADDAQR
ncbi:prepilin-type N-terminal cleavage/methylation domain-containing protein [Caldimonas sp. KR1-144]|uniref:prepilin-type N-terminal cleavage/methylation domain-containing protein n=1 Tax=Caldimonas sp. KR1-144 TaxID=3400911 RepID=UPI003C041472